MSDRAALRSLPVTLVKGEEACVTDLDDHTYVDFPDEFTRGFALHCNAPPKLPVAKTSSLWAGPLRSGNTSARD